MKKIIVALLALFWAIPIAWSQQRSYSQPELEQMLAPIALYPDPLLSQILMAATYPEEVVEASRWTRANPGLQGDVAVQAAQNADWDPSVKSLVAFPQVLQRMEENLDWTRALGDAFLGQQPYVMDTVQQLRLRAQAAGNLKSSAQVGVVQQGASIYIQPASPEVIYIPYYDPYVVYGAWRYPAYRPMVWAPWAGYVRPARPGFWWGRPVVVTRTVFVDRDRWHYDPNRRRGGGAWRDTRATQVVVPERREVPAERREQRYQRPPGRDLQDSRVLTPRSAQPPRMPAAAAPSTPQPQAQVRRHPQEERFHARNDGNDRNDRRNDRRETRPERGQAKGHQRG